MHSFKTWPSKIRLSRGYKNMHSKGKEQFRNIPLYVLMQQREDTVHHNNVLFWFSASDVCRPTIELHYSVVPHTKESILR